jgi:hypothetical protein
MTWTEKLLAAAIYPAMLVALGACTTKFKSSGDGDEDGDGGIEVRYTFTPGAVRTYNYPEPIPMDLSGEDRTALRVIHEDGRLFVFVTYDTGPSDARVSNIGVMALETGAGGNLPVDITLANQIQTPEGEFEFLSDSMSVESSTDHFYLFQSLRDHGAGFEGGGNLRVERIGKDDLTGTSATPILLFTRNAGNPDMNSLTSTRDGTQVHLAMTDEDPITGNTSYGVTVDDGYLEALAGGSPAVSAWADEAAVIGTSAVGDMSMVACLARYQDRNAVANTTIDLDGGSMHSSIAMFDVDFRPGQDADLTIDLCATEACAGMPNVVAMPMLLGIDFPVHVLYVGWMTSDSELNMESPGNALPPPYRLHGGTFGGGTSVSSGMQTPPITDQILPYDLRRMVSVTDFRLLLRRPEEVLYLWPSYTYEPDAVHVNFFLVSLDFSPLTDPAPVSVDTGMTQDLCRFYGFGTAVDADGVVYLAWNDWSWTGNPTDGRLLITGLKVMSVQFLPNS